jgi:hypothetical protein
MGRTLLTVQMRSARGEARSVRQQMRRCAASRPTDHLLDPAHEPPIGAHIVTPRRGYTHHGIYAGEGRVVQYGGPFTQVGLIGDSLNPIVDAVQLRTSLKWPVRPCAVGCR